MTDDAAPLSLPFSAISTSRIFLCNSGLSEGLKGQAENSSHRVLATHRLTSTPTHPREVRAASLAQASSHVDRAAKGSDVVCSDSRPRTFLETQKVLGNGWLKGA